MGLRGNKLGMDVARALTFILLATVFLCAAFIAIVSHPQIASATSYPGNTWSWYDYTDGSNDPGVYYALDCGQAQNGLRSAFVILDFGGLYGDGGDQINYYGIVHTQAQVVQLAENFAWGFTQCNSHDDYLALAIGTNNSVTQDYNAGASFGLTVDLFQSWVQQYAPYVSVWS